MKDLVTGIAIGLCILLAFFGILGAVISPTVRMNEIKALHERWEVESEEACREKAMFARCREAEFGRRYYLNRVGP